MKVAAVSHADIDAFTISLAHRAPTHANRAFAVLSKMFSLAIRWGWRTDNPCRGHRAQSGAQAARYLTGAELARLSEAWLSCATQGPPMLCGCFC